MFHRVAKQIASEMDPDGRFIAISSLVVADNYQPLCLVTKLKSRLPWQRRKHTSTSFKLVDVLKGGDSAGIELKHSDLFLYSTTTCYTANAKLSFSLQSTEVNIGGAGKNLLSVSQVSLRRTYVNRRQPWVIDPSNSFIQQVQSCLRLQLYVVVEILEIMAPLLIEETNEGEGKGRVTAMEMFSLQTKGSCLKKRSMQVPAGTVVAYVVEKLCFQEEQYSGFLPSSKMVQDSLCYEAFQLVKETIKEEYEILSYLSQPLKTKLLASLQSFLQDSDVVSALGSVLELSLAGGKASRSMLDSLDEDFRPQLETLLDGLGVLGEGKAGDDCDLWRPMHFLCSALEDLDERTLPFLEICLEKQVVAKLLVMLNGILEWILSTNGGSVFSPAHSLTEEELELAMEMLQTCHLISQAQRPPLTYLWNKKAWSGLTALYTVLHGLQILSK
uniref:Uncharacterized protein n=1 Tax=Sphenodon punctatus TaxID=8508 RepID=A0A8D0GP95_SPHPU